MKAQAAWKKLVKVKEIQDKQENDKMANITFVYTKEFIPQKRDAKPPIQPAEQGSQHNVQNYVSMYHDYFSHQKGKHLTDKSKVKIVEHFVKA